MMHRRPWQKGLPLLKVTDVVYVVHGEGVMVGVPVLQVMTAGCTFGCRFCDADHTTGARDWNAGDKEKLYDSQARWVTLTGGEPLQQDLVQFAAEVHNAGKLLHVETSGTVAAESAMFDFITCSPKMPAHELPLLRWDELKVLYHTPAQDLAQWFSADILARFRGPDHRCLQPVERPVGSGLFNFRDTVLAVKQDPRWRLSVQVHKWLQIS